jgi:hypothetical protein
MFEGWSSLEIFGFFFAGAMACDITKLAIWWAYKKISE